MRRSWSWRDMLPNGTALTLRRVLATEDGLLVEAEGAPSAPCPACGQPSAARHSRYWRSLKDVPAHGRGVTLRVRVSRWRCRNAGCDTAIFSERLLGVAAWHVQQTTRFGGVVHLVGHALGGRAGARLLTRLQMDISIDTILRCVKRGAPASPAAEAIRVLGIDDWAWQKGQQHFGTILVDLERRAVVDVLAVRTADAVAAWLAARPSIRVISRDRHGPYADGVRRGAPQARQVADRFHLVLNLRGAVQRALSQQRRFLVVPHEALVVTTPSRQVIAPRQRRRSAAVDHQRRIARERGTQQRERFHLVKRLQAAGHTAQAIMRETGIGRASVRKWIHLGEAPTRNRMAPQPGMPEYYREYLQRRWTEGCQSVRLLMAEIQPLGYTGCYSGLAKLVAPWRTPLPAGTDMPIDHDATREPDEPITCVPVRHVSPQVAAALLGQPRALLSARQAQTVDVLKQQCPGFTTMRRLVLSFRTILRVGKVATLHRWMDRAAATDIYALHRFVRTLRRDLSAVEGAVTERWSNGPVEGHINRLKMLRRQMYGRAGVELLRARLLPLPASRSAHRRYGTAPFVRP
ncbi:MAG: ISL3 family transposase [Acidobacteriota bacterium]